MHHKGQSTGSPSNPEGEGGTQSSPTATTEWERATWERRRRRKKGRRCGCEAEGSTKWKLGGDDVAHVGERVWEEC